MLQSMCMLQRVLQLIICVAVICALHCPITPVACTVLQSMCSVAVCVAVDNMCCSDILHCPTPPEACTVLQSMCMLQRVLQLIICVAEM